MIVSYNIIHHHMTTLSIPISKDIEKFIKDYIKSGEAENKAQVVRKALRKLAQDVAYMEVLQAQADVKAGRVFKGDLKALLRKV